MTRRRPTSRLLISTACALCLPTLALGADVDLPRFPSVSPDGERVAFSWRGDLWSVAKGGGEAKRLTSHPADETRSVWSPDGSMIAFESNRDGPRAIYVMDTSGANVRRVSLTDDSLTLDDWANGMIYVSGRIESDVYRASRPYMINEEGGEPQRVHDAFGQSTSAGEDGRVVFERGGSRTTRRHYRGPDDRDLFIYDRGDDSFTRITSWAGNDAFPVFRDDDMVLYLSDREDSTVNIYALDPEKGEDAARRLTSHTDRDITDFAVSDDGNTVAYIKWDELHVANFRGDRLRDDKRIRITAPADAVPLDELMNISGATSEAALSPDGKTIAVVAMGDVYVRAVEDDAPTHQVTDTMARERDVAWSPDNTTLYFVSDMGEGEAIYGATVTLTRDELKEGFTEATSPEPETEAEPEEQMDEDKDTEASEEGDEDASDDDADEDAEEEDEDEDKTPAGDRWADAMRFEIAQVRRDGLVMREPSPSPDGTRLAYRDTRGDVKILDLDTGDVRTLYESWDFSTEFLWSPDSQWIAYAVDDSDFNTDIFIVPADGSSEAVNITRHPDIDYAPRWSADGKVLAFLSTRNSDQADAYYVFLDRDLEALTSAELDEYFEDANKAAKKRGAIDPPAEDEEDGDDADEEDNDKESEKSKETEPAFTAEDLETAYLRLRRVTSYIGDEGSLELSGDGSRFVVSADAGPEGSGLYSVSWDGRDNEKLGSSADVQHVSRDGQTLVMVRGGRAMTQPVKGGKAESLTIRGEKKIDHGAMSAQKFDELSRELGTTFYHPEMKGLDWQQLTDDYRDLAVRAHTPGEFAWVASYFIGELNASHLGVFARGGFGAEDYRPSGSLGADVTRLKMHDGERTGSHWAYRVDRVLPLSSTQAGDMALMEGDMIVAIEFEPFGEGDTLDGRLAGRAGDETVVTVLREIGDEQQELHLLRTPISSGAEGRLRYNDWQRSRAALVDEWSGGRIGYLHIRAMGGADLIEFERDLFAAAEGKDGLLIDVRSNGGGWTTDRVLASIMYTPHAYTIPRGADPIAGQGYPRDRLFIQKYNLPINMLCNEKSFSNAEIVSHAFKTLGRGTLVGEETYGGVISTGGFSLVDNTFVRRPFRGWFLPDGTDMENNGAMPDIRVEQTPEDEAADYDAQLKAAVEDLLKRLD